MQKNILKNTLSKYLPFIFQLSVIATIPILFYYYGWVALLSIFLALVYQFFAILLTGHMIISHNVQVNKFLNLPLHFIYFYTTFIIPHFWAAIHVQHHKYPDSLNDPHSFKNNGFRVFFALWDPSMMDKKTFFKHTKNRISNIFKNNYVYLCVIPAVFLILFPIETLFIWGVPASLALSLSAIGAVYTHHNGRPINGNNIIEKIIMTIFFFGEGYDHSKHHNDPRANSILLQRLYD